ncbi:MAG: phosphoribosyl-ATP diphosphatase [Candidatus Margulisiibacteriota bacterium]
MDHFLVTLDQLIAKRKAELPEDSYTTTLFKAGVDRILRKVGEESGEVIIAAKNHDKTELAGEGADLLYHLMVLLHAEGLSLADVVRVLEDRHRS